jgi:hypothetical protein
MAIKIRILQTYDIVHEKEFLELEKRFADLEKKRKDFPQGKRYKPVSASQPTNTLVWEAEFPTMQEAYNVLNFFTSDAEHEDLAEKQRRMFKEVKIEFLETL